LVKEQVRDIHDITSVWSGERVKAATAKPDAKGGKRTDASTASAQCKQEKRSLVKAVDFHLELNWILH
jgi:hypothetical protein